MILLIILGIILGCFILILGCFILIFGSIWLVAMVQFIVQTIRDLATGNISGWTIASLIMLAALVFMTVAVFS